MGCWWWRKEVIYCGTWRRSTDFSDSWGWVIALILHGDLHLLSIVQRLSFQTKCFLFSFIDVEEMVSALVDTSNIQDSKYPMIELLLKHKALSQLMVMTWNTIMKVSSRISLKIPKKREKKKSRAFFYRIFFTFPLTVSNGWRQSVGWRWLRCSQLLSSLLFTLPHLPWRYVCFLLPFFFHSFMLISLSFWYLPQFRDSPFCNWSGWWWW